MFTSTLLLTLALSAASPRVEVPRYRVAFSGARRRVVHLDAVLPRPGDLLTMSPEGAEQVEGRWAAFVQDLRAHDSAGEPVELEDRGDGTWRVPSSHSGELNLSWKVKLEHDRLRWSFGIDEGSYLREDCVFVPTGALFIAPPDVQDVRVTFEVPDDWIVSAAWVPAYGEKWAFEAADHDELTRSVLLVGEHAERTIDAARAQWTLAVGAELAPHLDVMAEALAAAAEEAELLFGRVPAGRYLLIANRGDYTGGSARVGVMSLVLQFPPGTAYDHMWRHTLVHEMVHMWNGVTLRRKDRRCEWFAEGVTDYIAVLLLGRTGLADDEELLALLADSLVRYEASQGAISLAQAGENKRDNVDLVYAGGLWMGLLLDMELRQASGGEVTLEDYVQALLQEHGPGRPYSLTDLERVADRLVGGGMRRFFQRHVRGKRPIPVGMYLAKLGLEAVEVGRGRRKRMQLKRRGEASDGQELLRRVMLGVE